MSLFSQPDRNIGSVLTCDIYDFQALELPQCMIAFPVRPAEEFLVHLFSAESRQRTLHFPDCTLRDAGYGDSSKP